MSGAGNNGIFPSGCYVERRTAEHTVYRLDFADGWGRMTACPVMPGVSLILNDFHTAADLPGEESCPGRVEINHCREGQFRCVMSGGRALTLGPRDFAVSDMGHAPAVSSFTSGSYSGISLIIDPLAAQRPLSAMLGPDAPDLGRLFRQLFEQETFFILRAQADLQQLFLALYQPPSGCRMAYYKLKTAELLLFLSGLDAPAHTGRPYLSRDLSARVREVERRMTGDLSRRLPLDLLARQYQLSPTTLKKRFTQVFGDPPYAYLKRRRMEQAANLLLSSPLSVGEIALSVGYQNQSKFSHAFQSLYGLTPTDYKKETHLDRSVSLELDDTSG